MNNNGNETRVSGRGLPRPGVVTINTVQTFGDRVKGLMTSHGLTPVTLAAKCGVSAVIVRRWLRAADCQLSAQNLIKLNALFGTRITWLATGEGAPGLWSDLAENEYKLLRMFRAMNRDRRRLLIEIAGVMAKTHGK